MTCADCWSWPAASTVYQNAFPLVLASCLPPLPLPLTVHFPHSLRWDAPVPATNGAAAAAAAAPAAAVTAAPPTAAATSVVAAAAAAAQAAAVAARLSGAAGGVPAAAAGAGAAGAHLTPAAAAAVAAAAAAAMQRIPTGAPAGAGAPAAAGNGAATGAAKPGLTKEALEKLEKAKKLLQLQKEIQEKAKAKMAQVRWPLPVGTVSACEWLCGAAVIQLSGGPVARDRVGARTAGSASLRGACQGISGNTNRN